MLVEGVDGKEHRGESKVPPCPAESLPGDSIAPIFHLVIRAFRPITLLGVMAPVAFLLLAWATSSAAEGRSSPQGGTIVQASVATLSLPSVTISPGSQVTIPLTLILPQGQVYSLDATITYDPAIAPALGVQRGSSTAGWSMALNMDTAGVVRVALAGASPLETGGELLLLTFAAIGPAGSGTDLTLTRGDLNEGSILSALQQGHISIETSTATPTATATATATYSATSTSTFTATPTETFTPTSTETSTPSPTPTVGTSGFIAGVQFQARGSAPSTRWIVPLTVTLFSNVTGMSSQQFEIVTDPAGWFTVTDAAPGIYDLEVKKAHSLSNKQDYLSLPPCEPTRSGLSPEECPYRDLGLLLDGDANDDGTINALDYALLASAYLMSEGQPGYDERADFNDDGRINASDYAPLATNYLKRSSSPASLRR